LAFIIRIYHDARSCECQIRPPMLHSKVGSDIEIVLTRFTLDYLNHCASISYRYSTWL